MKILAIGNSFSRDATAYLHQVLTDCGVENRIVHLCIGGCPLERHWQNIEDDRVDYEYHVNGQIMERRASIRQALEEDDWDYIVTQQVSHDSGWAESYEPFLTLLVEYFHRLAPRAKLCLHQTWAYEKDSDHPRFMRYGRDQEEMYRRLTACYRDAAKRHDLLLIPCGDVVQVLRQEAPFRYGEGGMSLCRDGYHMHLIYGRYAAACTWARTLCGADLTKSAWIPSSEWRPELTAEEPLLALIRQTVLTVCDQTKE